MDDKELLAGQKRDANTERMKMIPELIQEIDETFRLLADNRATFPSDKLLIGLKSLGIEPGPVSLERSANLDDINQDEFTLIVSPYLSEAGWIMAEMNEAQGVFDQDGNGDLDANEVSQVLAKLGEKITKNIVQDQINQWAGRDGIVRSEQFFKMVLDRETIPPDESQA